MKSNLKCHLLVVVLLCLPGFAHAQGTAFNYQGRLVDNGAAANGPYDFVFSLHDAEVDGQAVGDPLTRDALLVSAGHFSVSLDFGAVFAGAARWLEIGVRASGAAEAFTTLAPRQALLPTPYAIFAETAGGVANGTVTAAQLKTDGPAPAPGQFLSYGGGNFVWNDPGVAAGGVWTVNGLDAYYSAGKVGIGTTAPSVALEVNGIVRSTRSGVAPQYVQLDGGDPGSIKLTAQSGVAAEKNLFIQNLSAEASPGPNNNIQFDLGTSAAPSTKMTIARSGSVGIGTTDPATKLTVVASQHGIEHTDGAVRLATYVGGSTGGGWFGTISNDQLNFYVNNGEPSQIIPASGFEVRFNTADLYLGHLSRRGPPGRALVDWVQPGTGVHQLVVNFANDWAETVIGGSVTEVKTLRITGGADLAEPFQMKEVALDKGSVVVIDEEHPGRLKCSTRAYDTRVAGIVSGANGINPGIALQQSGVTEGGQNVALSGRVYVRADASSGAIKPGDLLTSSDTPGHAMRVSDPAKAHGAILGKAMTALPAGQGMVLVLVTLQ